jgi:hypothetical protein
MFKASSTPLFLFLHHIRAALSLFLFVEVGSEGAALLG